MARIMVVDDEMIIAMQLEVCLRDMGHEIAWLASTGTEAVREAARLGPDLVLMDIVMPGKLDGIGAAERIRQDLNIPVVFLTAFSDDKVIERAHAYGFIIKPFQERQIKAAVEVALHTSSMERRLRESEARLRGLIEQAGDGFFLHDFDGCLVDVNHRACQMMGYSRKELLRLSIMDLEVRSSPEELGKMWRGIQPGQYVDFEGVARRRDGSVIPVEARMGLFGESGTRLVLALVRDVSERKRMEDALVRANEDLERRVAERTAELEVKTRNLEETNTALKILLKQREEDKAEIEDSVLSNVRNSILPYFEKIRKSRLNSEQMSYLEIIEASLADITSPFIRRLSRRYWGLTPTEIQVADLIRQGRMTKEIAELLHLAEHTILFHRQNVRNKMGLKHKRINLRSYLQAFPD